MMLRSTWDKPWYKTGYQVGRENLLFTVPVLEKLFHSAFACAIACEEVSHGGIFDAQQAP